MGNVSQGDTPTRPTRRPYALPLENGLRRVRTNSLEHDALLDSGYVPIESDDTTTILRLERRLGEGRDRRRRPADRRVTQHATHADLAHYRDHERGVLEQLAAEFTAMGHPLDASQLRWAMDEFRRRVMAETGTGRTVVSGRIR